MNGFEKNGLYYEIIDEKKKTIRVRYAHWTTKPTGALSIPENVENEGKKYTVTEIGGHGSYTHTIYDKVPDKRCKNGYREVPKECTKDWRGFERSYITSIKMPKTITKIGGGVFYECRNLTKVEMSPNVIEIGAIAFGWCTELEKVVLPQKIVKIGDRAFWGCKNLKSVNIPPLVEVIEWSTFDYTQIKTIEIPANVNLIKKEAFGTKNDKYPKEAIIDNSDGNLVIENGAFPAETKITYKGKSLLP